MKKIAFIYRDISFQAPLGMMYLSAVLKKAGYKVMLFLTEKDSTDELIRFNPDFLCYSVTTNNYKEYLDYNRKIKKRLNAMSLFGGPHATFFPEMINEDGVDGVCRGEGEEALLEIISKIDNNQDYASTKNWFLKINNNIVKNECRKLEMDIDKYPFPDRSTFFKTSKLKASKIWILLGSRGCPFQCSYCHNHLLKTIYNNHYPVRHRSHENILEEIQSIKEKYPVEMIIFTEDMFNLDKKWLEGFTEKYRKRLNIPYACNLRANFIDEDVASMLKKSNCKVAYLGIESGNENVRKNILNRYMSNKDILNASKLLNKNNIRVVALNILGIPGTTFSEDIDTLNLNIACRPFQAVGQLLQPYPNTKIYDYSIKLNLFAEEDIPKLGDLFTDSSLRFPPDQMKKITYLRDLFPFLVQYPFLFNFFNLFLLFPRKLFYYLNKIHYGYCKFRLFPVFNSPKEFFSGLKDYYNRERRKTS